MIKIKKQYILLIFIISGFAACKDTNEYRVESSFTVYLQRFENQALARGKNFDLSEDGLIIEFADLKDNTAGLTHYENPVRIEIDRTYWNDISKSAGADLMKEDLIFHELGHGLLGRKHLNTTLKNGDWKSIMCGGDKVDNRPWNINYKGMRQTYYIDELFDESTAAPEFSSTQFRRDTAGFKPSVYLNFSIENQADWPIVDDAQHKTSIENGRLRFESKVNDTYLVFAKSSINTQSDFTYELTVEYPISDLTNQYGLIFGYLPQGSNGAQDPIEYFTINNNKKMYMGNRTWYSFFTELSQPSIIARGKNKMKIVKLGQLLYYFINDTYCYTSEIETSESNSKFGFLVPKKGILWLDDFKISQRVTANAAAKVRPLQTVEFEMVRTPFEYKEIKNK